MPVMAGNNMYKSPRYSSGCEKAKLMYVVGHCNYNAHRHNKQTIPQTTHAASPTPTNAPDFQPPHRKSRHVNSEVIYIIHHTTRHIERKVLKQQNTRTNTPRYWGSRFLCCRRRHRAAHCQSETPHPPKTAILNYFCAGISPVEVGVTLRR